MTMPDAHDPHGPASAANGSDIATLLRVLDDFGARHECDEVHIPAGATQSGHTALALAIRLEGDGLVVEAIADDGARSEAPPEQRARVLDRIRATDPEMADRIEAAALDALGDEDTAAMREVTDGIDDDEDGLPTLEEALSLLDVLAREQSDAEGEVVPLQGALRAIAENNPERLSQRPILPALAKLRLDSKPDWYRIKGMLGRTLPPGLAETVRDKCTEVSRARRRRAAHAARGSMNHLLDDAVQIVEPGPEIDDIVEALKTDQDAPLKAEALDVLLALQRCVDEAFDAIDKAREHVQKARRLTVMHTRMGQAENDEDALSEEAAEAVGEELDTREQVLLRVMPGVMDRLREGGAKVGRVRFRIALGKYHVDGAAIVERIEKKVPLRHDERLTLTYDPAHLNENVDFIAETVALHSEVYWADRFVAINFDNKEGPSILELDARALIHKVAHHIDFVSGDKYVKTIPDKIGQTLLALKASERFNMPRELLAISASPMVLEDGMLVGIRQGYDAATRIFFDAPPALALSEYPTLAEAQGGLAFVREGFASFLWGGSDAPVVEEDGMTRMDTSKAAGLNESSALAMLLTAILRPVMDIAPGFVVNGARGSGSSSGKGKFVRAVAKIATGRNPQAVTYDPDPIEQEKIIKGALVLGACFLMYDNWNGARIKSPALATAITEPVAKIRLLGASKLYVILRHFLAVNGNDVQVIEDHANRWIVAHMDARTPDPESRKFTGRYAGDPVDRMAEQRGQMLGAALTIARWGLQAGRANPESFAALLRRKEGVRDVDPASSRFPAWDRAVRFPLMALGCADPALQHREAKANDPRRQFIFDLFSTWWLHHGADQVRVTALAQPVKALLGGGRELDNRGLGNRLRAFAGAREGGWHLVQITVIRKQAVWALQWEGQGAAPAREQGELWACRAGGVSGGAAGPPGPEAGGGGEGEDDDRHLN